jgi:hypothetical protein
MKYFTYELVASANDWIDQTEQARLDACRRFEESAEQYRMSLKQVKSRISTQAFNFFENGHGRWGLHDGRLISLTAGDGLDYRPDGTSPFRLNRQRTTARAVFINYEQDLLYTFQLRGIVRIFAELVPDASPSIGCVGDLFIYEIVAVDENLLQLGFLFASGASIVAQFSKLTFRRQRIDRKYAPGEMYR